VDNPAWIQCHASTIITAGPRFLVAFFAGTAEGAPDNRIWLSTSADLITWSAPVCVDEGEEVAHWNPVLAHDPDGMLWLFYKKGPLISAWQTYFRTSADHGATWSPAAELVPSDAGGRGPVKNQPLTVGRRWFAPSSLEAWGDAPGETAWSGFVDISDDSGHSWTSVPVPVDRDRLRGAGIIQPSLWKDQRGGISLLFRSSEGSAFLSRSAGGSEPEVVFTEARPVGLPNNNSGLDVVALPGGRLVCAHNPVDGDWGPRCPLGLSISNDDGETWAYAVTIEDGTTPIGDGPMPTDGRSLQPGAAAASGVVTTGQGEYSYPTLIVSGDRLVVSYSWQRRGIVAASIPICYLNL
jgi:predicted neuraminidase